MGNLIESVKQAGVVGAGGAGFPTHIKYQQKADYVIANGAECEPLLYIDKHLMVQKTNDLVEGLLAAVEAVGAKKGIIALKSKAIEAVEAVKSAIKGRKNLEIFLLKDFYPAGDEFVLTFEVLGRIVPEGGIPPNVNVVVNNVCTLINVKESLDNKPVIERFLTVTGWVGKPSTFSLPIGVSVREAVKLAGLAKGDDFKVILGGPMTGVVLNDLDTPITKTTSGVIVLPSDHWLILRKTRTQSTEMRIGKSACDQCRLCTDMCPRYMLGHNLQPHLIMRTIPYGISDSLRVAEAFLCCECNLCSFYACPLFLSPGGIFSILKPKLASAGIKNPHRNSNLKVRPFREYRKIPLNRLIERLGLKSYDIKAPLVEVDYKPFRVKIPLKQHIGVQAEPIVRVGEKIKKGDLIAKIPANALGANVHASITGEVKEIKDYILIES